MIDGASEIQSARDVTKANTYRVDTFSSRDLGLLGYVDSDGQVVFYRNVTRLHTTATPFDVRGSEALPRVDIEIPFTIEFDVAPLLSAVARDREHDGRWFGLRERLAHLGLAQGFDELLCLPHLTGVEPLLHQVETVRKVLKQFRGRVLLADEVGLGKTIEAGMVLKEYALRGMAERTLVLTPASLVGQWRDDVLRSGYRE